MQTIKRHTIILVTILLWSCVSVFAGEAQVVHLSSGENAAMFVNAEFAGGTTNTAKFSLYVSPYLVANQGGRYTKHIYIGSQRIVSKLGDLKSYGADPRRIEYAGSESDGPKVDYKAKYALQQQVIKDNFAHFDVPYNGADNNDYVDGKGFSERDVSLKSAMLKAASLKDNFQQGDSYEQYQYFYHPDHLGSSSFITNIEGEVVQHIEYVPYGEVFIEERNNVWNSPYLFNAKEFDEETGLYYYGARYYDSRLSLFYGTDRYTEKYPWQSAYSYAGGNPIKYIDVRGDSVAVLTAPKGAGGAGHLAILIQDEEGKWSLFSKNGTDEKYGIKGANRTENSINRPNDEGKLKYNTIDQFLNDSENNPIEDGQREYTEAFVIPCSKEQDRAAEIGAKAILNEDYNVLFSNCAQTVQNALDKAGLNDGNDIKYSPAGLPYKDRTYIPNRIYKNIKEQNKNGYVYTK